MVLIDMRIPSCCDECNAVGHFHAHTDSSNVNFFFCPNGSDVTRKNRKGAFKFRPDWCPMIEVEEKEIQERTSHVSWETRKVYVKKERQRDDNTGGG